MSSTPQQKLGERIAEWFKNNGVGQEGCSVIEMNKILVLLPITVDQEQLKETLKMIPKMVRISSGRKVDLKL